MASDTTQRPDGTAPQPSQRSQSSQPTQRTQPARPTRPATPRRPRGSRRLLIGVALGAVVAVLLGLGGALWVWFRDPGLVVPPGIPVAMSKVRQDAGLSDPKRLTASGTITVDRPGTVLTNLDVNGVINVKANSVTIRNVRVTSDSDAYGIRVAQGVRGVLVEHVEVVMRTCQNAGIGGGRAITVRYTRLRGCGDGIKLSPDSLYEYNYITVAKPESSDKHLDGLQDEGGSTITVRGNWVDVPASGGGNSAIIVKSNDSPIHDVVVEGNYLAGGNHTVIVDGKNDVSGIRFAGNVFGRGFRFGPWLVRRAEVSRSANVWADTRAAVR